MGLEKKPEWHGTLYAEGPQFKAYWDNMGITSIVDKRLLYVDPVILRRKTL